MNANDIRVGFSLNATDYNTIRQFAHSVVEALGLPEQLFLRKVADHNCKLLHDGNCIEERNFLRSAGLVDVDGLFIVPTFHGSLVITQLLKQGKEQCLTK